MSFGVRVRDDAGGISFSSGHVVYHVSNRFPMGMVESRTITTKENDIVFTIPKNRTRDSLISPAVFKTSNTSWIVIYRRPYPHVAVDMRYIVEVDIIICSV